MKTSQKILNYIRKNNQASGKELSDYLNNISPRAVRKQLRNLLIGGYLRKIGKPPKVYYSLAINKDSKRISIKKSIRRIIDKRYLFITPTGEEKSGWEGFVLWCERTKQDPIKTAAEYIETLAKYDRFRKRGLIDGMAKMKRTFKHVFLDKLFYLDFYSIERFGKTKLGQTLLYAKQSQNKELMYSLTQEIRPKILICIHR